MKTQIDSHWQSAISEAMTGKDNGNKYMWAKSKRGERAMGRARKEEEDTDQNGRRTNGKSSMDEEYTVGSGSMITLSYGFID